MKRSEGSVRRRPPRTTNGGDARNVPAVVFPLKLSKLRPSVTRIAEHST